MSASVHEHHSREKSIVGSPALTQFTRKAVDLYQEENTWQYMTGQGIPTMQMLLADFDVDQSWEKIISRLPERFAKRAQHIHNAVAAARPFKRALIDESILATFNTTTGDPPIRISLYQELEIAAWENLRLRGAHTSHVLTDILLYTNPHFISNPIKNTREIQRAAKNLFNSVITAAQMSPSADMFPADRIIEGLLRSPVPIAPPSRRSQRTPSSAHR